MTQITGTSQSEVNEALTLIATGICTVCKLEDADPNTATGTICKRCDDIPPMIWH